MTTVRGQLLEILKVDATALEQDLRDRLVFVDPCLHSPLSASVERRRVTPNPK